MSQIHYTPVNARQASPAIQIQLMRKDILSQHNGCCGKMNGPQPFVIITAMMSYLATIGHAVEAFYMPIPPLRDGQSGWVSFLYLHCQH